MTQTTAIGGLGLFVFALSSFTPTQRFGTLMLALLTAALVGDLIFLPAILAGPLGRFFDVGRRAMEDGFPPDTISSDLHALNIDGPVFDLPTTMSKFLNLGMPLEEVISRTTAEPAKAIDRSGDLGHLGVGATGDIAVIGLETGQFDLVDTHEEVLKGDRRLVCRASVRAACW